MSIMRRVRFQELHWRCAFRTDGEVLVPSFIEIGKDGIKPHRGSHFGDSLGLFNVHTDNGALLQSVLVITAIRRPCSFDKDDREEPHTPEN